MQTNGTSDKNDTQQWTYPCPTVNIHGKACTGVLKQGGWGCPVCGQLNLFRPIQPVVQEKIEISVFSVINHPSCISVRDGSKIYHMLLNGIYSNKEITLSFLHITTITTSFLDVAIGQLYRYFTDKKIRAHITIKDVEPTDIVLIKHIVDNAKEFYKNTKRIDI